MLENVKFFRIKLLNYFLIIFFFTCKATADEVVQQIIEKINSFNSLIFNFDQESKGINEKGKCTILFPGKINCLYSNKDKRLIINRKVMAIIEKKYDKVYLFPSKRSPLTLILEKDKLENFLLNGEYKIKDNRIIFNNYIAQREIKIFFDKREKLLLGWEITNGLEKKIKFNIKNLQINGKFDKKDFRIPKIN